MENNILEIIKEFIRDEATKLNEQFESNNREIEKLLIKKDRFENDLQVASKYDDFPAKSVLLTAYGKGLADMSNKINNIELNNKSMLNTDELVEVIMTAAKNVFKDKISFQYKKTYISETHRVKYYEEKITELFETPFFLLPKKYTDIMLKTLYPVAKVVDFCEVEFENRVVYVNSIEIKDESLVNNVKKFKVLINGVYTVFIFEHDIELLINDLNK